MPVPSARPLVKARRPEEGGQAPIGAIGARPHVPPPAAPHTDSEPARLRRAASAGARGRGAGTRAGRRARRWRRARHRRRPTGRAWGRGRRSRRPGRRGRARRRPPRRPGPPPAAATRSSDARPTHAPTIARTRAGRGEELDPADPRRPEAVVGRAEAQPRPGADQLQQQAPAHEQRPRGRRSPASCLRSPGLRSETARPASWPPGGSRAFRRLAGGLEARGRGGGLPRGIRRTSRTRAGRRARVRSLSLRPLSSASVRIASIRPRARREVRPDLGPAHARLDSAPAPDSSSFR